MKNISLNKILASLLVITFMALMGCEKVFEEALDRADDSRETLEGMLNDPNKVWGMLNSCYSGMMRDRSDLYFWTTHESLTDNCFDAQGQSMENWRSGLLTPSFPAVWASRNQPNSYVDAGQGSFWGRYWGAIRHCNTLIEHMPNVTATLEELPQSDRDQMVEEAKAMRAYFHWLLISYYGPLPFMEENLPVNFEGWGDMSRPAYDSIATRIADECQGIIDRGILPMRRDPLNTNDKYRIPLAFVYGLKSRVLLYNASPLNNPSGDVAKYERAAAAAKQFLDKNAFSLEPFENTKRMYLAPITENVEAVEVIWRGRDKMPQMNNVHGMNLSVTEPKQSNYANFKAGETPTQEIVDCYEMKNGAMVINQYDATHANPMINPDAAAAGYDDANDPYSNRDDRFYRDILFNGNVFGESYQMGEITVWTYLGCKGTGTNGNSVQGDNKNTYTGYYWKKDRNPLHYGKGEKGDGHARNHTHTIWMRYAEIYLNYAEALCGAGRLSEACDALDMTRLRANQPSIREVPGYQENKEWLMKRIQNERRVELAIEDHRFFDVRRWDIISNDQNNTISGMLVEKQEDGSFTHSRYQMPFTWACHNEKYKVLPIPLADKKLLRSMDQPVAWQ